MAFKIIPEDAGFYTVKDVPIFKKHDDRGFPCDDEWMNSAIETHNKLKADGYRPMIVVGHNQKGVEKESAGFIDNPHYDKQTGLLYADFVRVPEEIKEKIVHNKYPNRSVEVLPQSKRILCMALLGGTSPHFALPQMVYSDNKEPSLWYRSPNMSGFTDEQKAELKTMLGDSLKEVVQNYAKDEGPQVYELPLEKGIEILNSGEQPEFFEGEDGTIYTMDDKGNYYKWHYGLMDLIRKGAAVVSKGPVGQFVRKHPTGVVLGAQAATVGGGMAVAHHIGRGRGKQGKKAGFVGAMLGGPAYVQGVKSGAESAGYSFDPQTGIMYYEDQAVGEVVPTAEYDPTAVPPGADGVVVAPDTDPGPETAPSSGSDPGEPQTELLEEVDRAESEQFAMNTAAQVYELQQQVARLTQVNDLLQVGNKAKDYEQYLLNLKQKGAPVGNITETVEYMLTQTPQQLALYKRQLENAPKVALGRMEIQGGSPESPMNFDRQDFEKNKELYAKLGVDAKTLQYAQYAMHNQGVGEV